MCQIGLALAIVIAGLPSHVSTIHEDEDGRFWLQICTVGTPYMLNILTSERKNIDPNNKEPGDVPQDPKQTACHSAWTRRTGDKRVET